MWKCKWGCDIFHHRAASSVDKPVNAASSKVLSDQISDVITSINELRTQSFGRLRWGGRNQSWTKSCEPQSPQVDKCCVLCSGCVKTSCTQRKRKQISEVGDVRVSDVQKPNHKAWKVLKLLRGSFGGLCQIRWSLKCADLKFVFAAGSWLIRYKNTRFQQQINYC